MRNALPLLLLLTIPLAGTPAAADWLDAGQPAGMIGPRVQEAQPIAAASPLVRLPKVERPEIIPVSATLADSYVADEEYYTLDELKAEMKKIAWTKGDFRIVPYGAFWADMIYATERTAGTGYTLYVYSADTEGEPAFDIDARRTRFGLDVAGPKIPFFNCAESGGRVEIDFQSSLFSTENKPGVLLRHAYWEVKNEEFKILIGQTWDVISPLYPQVLNYTVGWDGGNIGYRRAQFRYERYHTVSDSFKWDWEFALAQDITNALPGFANAERESSSWPVIEGRIGCKLGNRPCVDPISLGCSAHIGATEYDFLTDSPDGGPVPPLPPAKDQQFRTWSFNIDLRVPITQRLGVEGEFFTGANLDSYFGGIGQGVCPCLRVPIRSTGGWFDAWYDISPRWHAHAGFGIDDPRDNDILFGRVYNRFVFGNIIFDITKKLNTGLEITSWKTLYQDTRTPQFNTGPTAPGESVTIDWMVKYGF